MRGYRLYRKINVFCNFDRTFEKSEIYKPTKCENPTYTKITVRESFEKN